MSTNQEAQSLEQTLDQTLEQTGLGHAINENKKLIIVLGAIVVALIIAYAVFSQMSKAKHQERLDDMFNVETSVFTAYTDGKSDASAFKTKLSEINADYIGAPVLVPAFLTALNKLEEEKAIDASVLAELDKWLAKIHKTDYLKLFVALRASAIYEDQGDLAKAISILEEVKDQKATILKEKVHFELGRMYLSNNNIDKANAEFDTLIKDHKDSEYAKLAEVYKSGL